MKKTNQIGIIIEFLRNLECKGARFSAGSFRRQGGEIQHSLALTCCLL